ncbi:YciI family protein [Nocardioides rubriscoriae]|uniref:YciI family protein n=1 Tax=Nocardioides rubriscoriae TaxID=642762 RepID=UPI0011E0362A|nr:YciI family protein [Nocardioides rubriscoriae]
MSQYVIFFNQQWVGDHSAEWFGSRGPLARAVVDDIKAAGAFVAAGGLEEDDAQAAHADATSGALVVGEGPYAPDEQRVGGLTIIDVEDDATARVWAGRIAEACGWPQEVRRLW